MPANSAFLQPWFEPVLGRWLYVDSMLWTVVGFLGAAIFGSRFVLQWLKSEKEKKLVVPWYFWHLSFWGSVLNLLYFLHLDKAPLILGNCFLPFLYGRNILFLRREGTKGGGRKVFAAVAALVLAGFLWSVFFGKSSSSTPGPDRDPTTDTRADLQRLAEAFKGYHAEHGSLPQGDASTVVKTLRGLDPAHPTHLEADDRSLSSQGEWLDHWGRPVQIFISERAFLLRSAGANGVFEDVPSNGQDDVIVSGSLR